MTTAETRRARDAAFPAKTILGPAFEGPPTC